MKKKKDIKTISISELFTTEAQYIIPIYQRNYAWSYKERFQLIEDILDLDNNQEYFLGSLVVHQRDDNKYEVIDGQQRLTTLYILLKAIKENVNETTLEFEARIKSNEILKLLTELEKSDENELNHEISMTLTDEKKDKDEINHEIIEGYYEYLNYFNMNKQLIDQIRNKLKQVKLLRIVVPKDTDLNHYFEIMNTRGKQLEAHEILKAKLMSKLNGEEKDIFALIWDAVANMDNYIQMSFKSDLRSKLFGDNYELFNPRNFDETVSLWENIEKEKDQDDTLIKERIFEKGKLSLKDAILEYDKFSHPEEEEEKGNERFESIISFPDFLLQTLKVLYLKKDESEITTHISLDDKKLIETFNILNSEDELKTFIYLLLKLRFLFDKYILKRDYNAIDSNEGRWSIKTLKTDRKNKTVYYIDTFNEKNNMNMMIQSMFRITYTSPQTMHWLTEALFTIQKDDFKEDNLNIILEDYAATIVKESNYKEKTGFQIERIVFTYIDYLLWKNKDMYFIDEESKKIANEFTFIFRNSIEHLYPQNPLEDYEEFKELGQGLGNLFLISASSNSKLSNFPPEVKIKRTSIVNSSLKLKHIAMMLQNIDTTNLEEYNRKMKEHGEEMFRLLEISVKECKINI